MTSVQDEKIISKSWPKELLAQHSYLANRDPQKEIEEWEEFQRTNVKYIEMQKVSTKMKEDERRRKFPTPEEIEEDRRKYEKFLLKECEISLDKFLKVFWNLLCFSFIDEEERKQKLLLSLQILSTLPKFEESKYINNLIRREEIKNNLKTVYEKMWKSIKVSEPPPQEVVSEMLELQEELNALQN